MSLVTLFLVRICRKMTMIICGILCICFLVLFSTVKSYPVKRNDLITKLAMKDEKRYPNGTIIGKYTYKDKDGNPIHVKYYADDSSYGVELKSVKVFDDNSDIMNYKLPKLENMISTPDILFQPLETVTKINTMLDKDFYKNKSYSPIEILNSYTNKINRYKAPHKGNDDYEIFSENDLKSPAKCDKEKVKVYLDKSKRKTRNAPYHYTQSDYCKRF